VFTLRGTIDKANIQAAVLRRTSEMQTQRQRLSQVNILAKNVFVGNNLISLGSNPSDVNFTGCKEGKARYTNYKT